jgi:hypothetical protein
MKTSTVIVLGAAAAAGVYFMTRKAATMPSGKAPLNKVTLATMMSAKPIGKLFAASAPAKSATSQQNYAAPAAGNPSVSAKDVVSGAAAVGAGAACAAIPTGGALVAPLCGSVGGYLGAKAYDYGEKAIDEVSGWFGF